MRVVLALLAIVVSASVMAANDYYLPNTAARGDLYTQCKTDSTCSSRGTDQGACLAFCFLDLNADGEVTEQEGLSVHNMIGGGQDVPHSDCVAGFKAATQNLMSDAEVGVMCFSMEHIGPDGQSVISEQDIKNFVGAMVNGGEFTFNISRFLSMLNMMLSQG